LDPAKITLLSFAAVLGIGALGIAAAEAGLWELPPRAAAMLGVENARASLSSAKPGQKPHLVMPAEPKPKVEAPAPLPEPQPVPQAEEEPAAAEEADGLRLNPPPGAVAPQSSAAAWNMVEEQPPAPLLLDAPNPVAEPSASDPEQPAVPEEPAPASSPSSGAGKQTSTTVAPANLASATAPGTMPAAVAATPKAVVTLSPAAAPSSAGESEVEEFTLDEASGNTPGDRAVSAKLVALARSKLRSRDPAGAAEMMLRQVTVNPNDHHAMEILIRAWIAMGRGDDAVGYAELIVKKRPRRAAYRILEGDARLAAGDPAGAQVAWRVALQLEPENIDAKRRLGLQ
jgi:hypothetical protein